jgi:glutathione peroxidase
VDSIHTFTVEGIANQQIDFSGFTGKKIMIVNVASRCGFTPQYAQLQELYDTYQDQLVIVGFPANDFGGQEPGTNQEIQSFCTTNYGVTFPMAAKIQVTGTLQHPVYSWLTQKSKNRQQDSTVNWNFHKFLLDEQGQLVNSLPSSVSPFDDQILDWLNAS